LKQETTWAYTLNGIPLQSLLCIEFYWPNWGSGSRDSWVQL